MNKNDKISIILPCYNAEKHIERCINSVLNQTYRNIELIIIDDGSKDTTLEILNKFKGANARVKIISKENTGVSDSRNIGIEKSTGDYIMFIDSDDFYEPNTVEILYKAIMQSKASIVRGSCQRCKKNEKIKEHEISKFNSQNINKIVEGILNGDISCYVWLLIIKKEILKQYNIKFDKKLKIMEDTLFYIKLLEKERIYFLDEVVYNYVENDKSATGNVENTKNIYDEMLKAEIKIIEELKNNNLWNDDLKNIAIRKIIINGICNCTWNLYKHKDKNLLNEYLEYINSNEIVKNAFTQMTFEGIRLDKKIAIKLIRKNKIKLLYLVYGVKYFMYKLLRK